MRFPRRGSSLAVGALLAVGCTRSVPSSYPENAALSPQAPEATPAHVTLALHREPPLPGGSMAGWPGLLEGAPAGEPAHEHHHHHHMHHGADAGMAMQVPADGGMHHAH